MIPSETFYHFTHGLATMFFIYSSVLIIGKSDKTRLQKFLLGVLLYWLLLELKDLFFYDLFYDREGFASQMIILIDNSAAAAGCLYVLELTTPRWCTWWRSILFCSPYLLSILLFALFRSPWVIHIHMIYLIISTLILFVYVRYAVRRHNRYVKDNYSDIEEINIGWLTITSNLLSICLAAWIATCLLASWVADSLFQLGLILLWGTILYFTLRHKEIPIQESEFDPSGEEENLSHLLIQRNLEREIYENKIFLNPQLTLTDLATAIGTNRSYLSVYLNHELKTSFYDYINSFRLKMAMERLANPDCTEMLVEISEQCGFNSLSTFRRVFHRAHGCSVGEWRRKALKEGFFTH